MHTSFTSRRQARRSERGFTLAELLIVVVILGALASTVVVASGGFRDKGVEPACRSALRAYEVAFEGYRADNANGYYPNRDNQVVPTYVKRTGGSSAAVSGTPEVAVVTGKGWTFTITYGALAGGGATAGSTAAPTFSAATPAGCLT
jgi:prepilin-type N-terminal cleavage/methylation domain-containing protein